MPFKSFSRRGPTAGDPTEGSNNPEAGNASADHPNSRSTTRSRGGKKRRWTRGERFGAGAWLRMFWVDIVTMAAMGAVGLGVYEAKPAPSRSFPVTFSDSRLAGATGDVIYPQFAYPLRKEIIPIWLAALLAFIVPFSFFVISLLPHLSPPTPPVLRLPRFLTLTLVTSGLLYSLITAAVFQVFIKWLIGGLRPHFLDVCKPELSGAAGDGYGAMYFHRTVCTGDPDQIDDSLESMPSGHATAAWAGFFYLTLFFNAHLKFLADTRPRFWKMIVTFAPMLGAFLISGALTIDEFHNWYDVLVGGIIGSVSAACAYRATFAAIWDFRFNHLLFVPGERFVYVGEGGVPGDASAASGNRAYSARHYGDSASGRTETGPVRGAGARRERRERGGGLIGQDDTSRHAGVVV